MDDQIYVRLLKLEEFMVGYPKFIEAIMKRISDCEDLGRTLSKDKTDNKSYLDFAKEFDKKLEELKCCNQNTISQLEISIKDSIKSSSDLKNYILENEKKINSLSESIIQITNQIQHFFAEIDKFTEFKKEIENKWQYFDMKFSEQNTAISKSNEKFDKINEQFKSIDSKFLNVNVFDSNLDLMIRDLSKNVNENKLNIDNKFGSLSSTLAIKLDDMIKSVNEKIDLLPKPQDTQKYIDEFKTVLDPKLNLLSLDVRNSNIRSQNSEDKLTILEKNVEYIQLLLKKLQNQ